MLKSLLVKVFGSPTERTLKSQMPTIARINELEPGIKSLSDEELRNKTVTFRERLANGETLEDLLPEAFATVREAAVRSLGMRHFDVQLLGGIILFRGAITEMKTGEGKTLTATLPVYLHALTGKGVFVVTVNDYLAKRDAEWMGRVYRFLGMTVGTIVHEKDDRERREAYQCDITYGTNNEFGFDYLRDNMKFNAQQLAQRGFNFAIVDEVDSVLIDEARTPLIISGPAEGSVAKYYDANAVVVQLSAEKNHFTVDEKDHHALFAEEGIRESERLLKVDNLYDPENIEILHCLEQSLRAHHLFKRDIDYVVENDEVVIIDSHTGRKMPGRRYSDGLHQALESKEGVKIEQENQTLATVTFQNFFRMFTTLSGMTGTAETEATEFFNIYKLEVYVIPTNLPMIRDDRNDLVYGTNADKIKAIVEEIKTQHATGRPVLVGTISIEASEDLSRRLEREKIKHVVLNAKFHAMESEIVAQAGRHNAVTIATNMAGRGTDIVLGGNPEMLANADLARNPELNFEEQFAKYKAICAEEKKRVLELGGLCIVGTERHESRRIDNQLRGRAGRQGDPGYSQFFLSLQDNLMRLFGNERMKRMLIRNMEEGAALEHKMVNKAIIRAQKSVENRNFEIRKHLLEYDDVINMQRNTFYRLRYNLLNGSARDYLYERSKAILQALFEEYAALPRHDEEETKSLRDSLRTIFFHDLGNLPDRLEFETFSETVFAKIREQYEAKWDALEVPADVIADHERFIMLFVIDQQWKDHMRNMDHLKQGISLQGYAQKDPLIEYKKASLEMFNGLMDRMDEEVVKTLINLRPKVGGDESLARMRRQRAREANSMKLGGDEGAAKSSSKTYRREEPKVGRNAPCPCGSGKKFKQCHGRA